MGGGLAGPVTRAALLVGFADFGASADTEAIGSTIGLTVGSAVVVGCAFASTSGVGSADEAFLAWEEEPELKNSSNPVMTTNTAARAPSNTYFPRESFVFPDVVASGAPVAGAGSDVMAPVPIPIAGATAEEIPQDEPISARNPTFDNNADGSETNRGTPNASASSAAAVNAD